MSHRQNLKSTPDGLPEVQARAVPSTATTEAFDVEEAAVLLTAATSEPAPTAASSTKELSSSSGKEKGYMPPFGHPHHQTQTSASSSGEYWGRFDDPQVTVLPTGDDADDAIPVATARLDDRKLRHAFLRKVYLILAAQMFVTFAVCALIALYEPTRNFALGSSGIGIFYMNQIVMLLLICALRVKKREHPTNMYLLGAFTVSAAYLIGTVTAIYAVAGAGELVVEAAFITATVFIVLTLYTLQSKWDFSFLGAGLGMCLWILILWGLFGLIFGMQTGSVYALLGSVVFSLFIIYDTYMIAERVHPDDYVIAAIELYLDIINLFLYILRLLSANRR